MHYIIQYHEAAAVFIVRVFLGVLFFFQGFDAVFKVRVSNIIETYEYNFEKKGISKFFTVAGSWFTSYVELICGFLLIIGLFQYYALCLLGIDIIIASLAFAVASPMWDTRHIFPRIALITFLLVIPPSWHQWTIDNLLFTNTN